MGPGDLERVAESGYGTPGVPTKIARELGIEVTHRKLVSIADEFGTLRAKTVRQVLHEKRLQPLGLAARLSMLCGAFGDGKSSPTEPDSTTFHRVKKNYENARDMNARLVVR